MSFYHISHSARWTVAIVALFLNGTTIVQFGATSDHPAAADYDRDGRADRAQTVHGVTADWPATYG